MRNWLLALGVVLVTSGCGSHRSGGGDPYIHAWYNVYGTYCGTGHPMPGCNFYADGSKILDREDPYARYQTVQFALWTYTDSFGYPRSYRGFAWLSPDGILYDDYGYALNEGDDAAGRDLMSDVGAQESRMVSIAARGLRDRYALSEDSSLRIAQTLQDWALLGKKQGRTQEDLEATSRKLFGQSLDKIRPALEEAAQGDRKKLEAMNQEVATYWGTQPETSKAILTRWYQSEITAAQGN